MIVQLKETMDRSSVAALSIGHVCIDLCQGAIPALLPFLLIQRHLSYTSAGSLVLATNLASSVIQPLFGRFADRFSAPWLMPVGLVLAGIGLALAGFAPNYWLIVLSLALTGIGIAAFHPEAARLMNVVAGPKKATAMSIFSIGGNVGFALGPLLTSTFLILLGLGGAALFLIPILLVSLLLVAFFRHLARFVNASKQQSQKEQVQGTDAWSPFARLTAMIMCRSVIFYGLNTFLPLYWVVVLHQSSAFGASALTVLLAAGILGTFIGGRLADRYGRRTVVLWSLSSLAPLLLLFIVFSTTSIILALLLLLPLGLALFAPFSVMVVMGQEYLPNSVGTASGVTLGLAVTIGGITAPVFGHVADLYGIHIAMISLALFPLLGTVLALTLPRPPLALRLRHAS